MANLTLSDENEEKFTILPLPPRSQASSPCTNLALALLLSLITISSMFAESVDNCMRNTGLGPLANGTDVLIMLSKTAGLGWVFVFAFSVKVKACPAAPACTKKPCPLAIRLVPPLTGVEPAGRSDVISLPKAG